MVIKNSPRVHCSHIGTAVKSILGLFAVSVHASVYAWASAGAGAGQACGGGGGGDGGSGGSVCPSVMIKKSSMNCNSIAH